MLSQKEVIEQSKSAFKQWGNKWKDNARQNGLYFKEIGHTHKELMFRGAGKTCLCVAMGPSLEDNIDIIKKYADNPAIEIFAVDKAVGFLIDNDIMPNYVNIADASIDYSRWLEPWVQYTEQINLVANITGNVEYISKWRRNVNNSKPIQNNNIWFYVNKDNIKTEEIYVKESGCTNLIPAGSNVGNSVVIFAASILGYYEIILIGYDFAWQYKDNYYAFCDEKEIGTNKRGWMRHINMIDKAGEITNTSQNLIFSSKWLSDYYNMELKPFNIKIFDCSRKGILFGIPDVNLKKKLKNAKIQSIHDWQKNIIANSILRQDIITNENGGDDRLKQIIKDNNIFNVMVNYITPEQDTWLKSL